MLQTQQPHVEYTIYVYDRTDDDIDENRWTKLESCTDPKNIHAKAQNLYSSRQYKKIEIQKKYFDARLNKKRAQIVRTFEERNSENYFMLATILLMAISSLGLFYLMMT